MSYRLRPALVRRLRPQGLHPIVSSPLAIRMSQWSLPFILTSYLLVTVSWSLLVTAAIWSLASPDQSVATSAREGLAALWAPGDLLLRPGQPLALYVVGTINAFVSVLLPVFVLGSFIYKLFGQDPIVWRKRLSIEAAPPESHPVGVFVLVARFYNQITVDATDIRVRAWLRFSTSEYNPSVLLNKRLELLVRGQRVEEWVLPLMQPTDVTAIRVVLSTYTDSPDPVADQWILMQGENVQRATASIVLIVEGTLISLNETFRSSRTYALSEDVDTEIYQDISLGQRVPTEWANFEGVQWSYVFFYGQSMAATSLRALGIAPEATSRATLVGWRRSWNTPTNPRAMAGTYFLPNDSAFDGIVMKLGVERCEPTDSMTGIVARVDYRMLAVLDSGEPEYVRTDVTHNAKGMNPGHAFRVFVYAPRQSSLDAFAAARHTEAIAVSGRYLDSIRSAALEGGSRCVDEVEASRGLVGLPVVHRATVGSVN